MDLDRLDSEYEKNKVVITSTYKSMIDRAQEEKNSDKKNLIKKKADKWLQKKLDKLTKSYNNHVKHKIFLTILDAKIDKFMIKVHHTNIKILKKINKHFNFIQPIVEFFYLIIAKIIEYSYLFMRGITSPFRKLLHKPIRFLMINIFYPIYYKFDKIFIEISHSFRKTFFHENPAFKVAQNLYTSLQDNVNYTELKNHLNHLAQTKVIDMDLKEISKIDRNQTIKDALEIIKTKGDDVLFVSDYATNFVELIGTVGEKEIIDQDVSLDLLSKKIDDIYCKNIMKIDSDTTFLDAINIVLKNKDKVITVTEQGGIYRLRKSDFLRQIDHFSKKFLIETIYLKRINEIMTKEVISISKKEKATYIRITMNRQKKGFLIVIEPRTKEPVGIITRRDFLMEELRDLQRLRKFNVEHIMHTPISHIEQNLQLISANSKMLQKSFRKQAVFENEKLIGIITQSDLLKEIYEYFKLTLDQANAGKLKTLLETKK